MSSPFDSLIQHFSQVLHVDPSRLGEVRLKRKGPHSTLISFELIDLQVKKPTYTILRYEPMVTLGVTKSSIEVKQSIPIASKSFPPPVPVIPPSSSLSLTSDSAISSSVNQPIVSEPRFIPSGHSNPPYIVDPSSLTRSQKRRKRRNVRRKEKGLEYEKLMAKGGVAAVIKANRKKEEQKQAGKRKKSSSVPDNSESSPTRQMKKFFTSLNFSQSQDSYSSDGPGAMFEEKEDWEVGG